MAVRVFLAVAFAFSVFPANVYTADKKPPASFENAQLRLQLFPWSTEQMAAFFEARGFPTAMIEELSAYCFFTASIKNKRNAVLQLDLTNWDFVSRDGRLQRIPRSQWPPLWKKMNVPLASQSTFRWMLLPETLHFYAHEKEGGNIVLKKTKAIFSLRARFGLGENTGPVVAMVNNLQCADATEVIKSQ
ncbi:MAG: hypothetical protein GXP18_05070 [Gammaproteobacteria bacterium]|nr:hypothetical protein [Gammaproteobacteria bacterium]